MIRNPDRVVTREEAEARRLRWYFTGEPCANGHIAPRSMANYNCYGCKRKGEGSSAKLMTYAQWEQEHKRKQREMQAKWKAERRAKRQVDIAAKLLS